MAKIVIWLFVAAFYLILPAGAPLAAGLLVHAAAGLAGAWR